MHQLCGLVLLEGGVEGGRRLAISMELCSGSGGLALPYFALPWV